VRCRSAQCPQSTSVHSVIRTGIDEERVGQRLLLPRLQNRDELREPLIAFGVPGARAAREAPVDRGDRLASRFARRPRRAPSRIEKQQEYHDGGGPGEDRAPRHLGEPRPGPAEERDPSVAAHHEVRACAAEAESPRGRAHRREHEHRDEPAGGGETDRRDQGRLEPGLGRAQEREERQQEGHDAPRQPPARHGDAAQPMDRRREGRVPDRQAGRRVPKGTDRRSAQARGDELAPEEDCPERGDRPQGGEGCQGDRARREPRHHGRRRRQDRLIAEAFLRHSVLSPEDEREVARPQRDGVCAGPRVGRRSGGGIAVGVQAGLDPDLLGEGVAGHGVVLANLEA